MPSKAPFVNNENRYYCKYREPSDYNMFGEEIRKDYCRLDSWVDLNYGKEPLKCPARGFKDKYMYPSYIDGYGGLAYLCIVLISVTGIILMRMFR